jgi:hypothetical protein
MHDGGTMASLIGMGLSVYVLFEVKALRRKFIARVRLPELSRKLRGEAKSLKQQLINFDASREQISLTLTRIERVLHAIEAKANPTVGSAVADTRKTIKSVQMSPLTAVSAQRAREKIESVLEDIDDYNQSEQWSIQ